MSWLVQFKKVKNLGFLRLYLKHFHILGILNKQSKPISKDLGFLDTKYLKYGKYPMEHTYILWRVSKHKNQ